MYPTENDIKEIAEFLECGEVCFYHKKNGIIKHYPDPDGAYFDPEPWQEIIDKIDADRPNYLRFDVMGSQLGFQVMEDFANSIADQNFRTRLLLLLSKNKPFSNFKHTIDNSEYRQAWFNFRHLEYVKCVHQQIQEEQSNRGSDKMIYNKNNQG